MRLWALRWLVGYFSGSPWLIPLRVCDLQAFSKKSGVRPVALLFVRARLLLFMLVFPSTGELDY
jgi:hypothetical protein